MTQRWLDQVESLARDALPEPVFRYVAEGARDEITLRESVKAWQAIRIAPRVLCDVRTVETSTDLLGSPFDLPVGIAPMTLQRAADPDGEVAMARAAAETGVPLVVSSNAGSTFADIAATGVTWWLQVYVPTRREDAASLLEAAVAAGAAAVVLTADTPVLGTRYRLADGPHVWEMADPTWVGANASGPPGLAPEDRTKAMDLGPADIGWLAGTTGLPVVVKGVLRPDDARRCTDAGARAVWVSNHGGRQLDQAVATAGCVAAVRAAVGDAAQVYVDGGVRSGLHVLLALALGADAAFVGRPLFHALAAGGADGAVRALRELGAELVESMRLSGCATLAQTQGIACPDRGFWP
ncbi:MAG TPA: alpha-hydroxy acid oxidase [Propionicimonas sp.]|nr:alpha-hydroxy acid oxidase [Propionicimonas sp.]